MHIYLAKSSRFESTDFASVMIFDDGCSPHHQSPQCNENNKTIPWEKNCHCELTVSSTWAHRELTVTTVVTAPGPMITAQSRLGEVTAQSRLGHSSVTARSQPNHGIFSMITAQSRLGQSSITAQVTAKSRLAVTILVTVSSRWAHCELTVSSHGGQFFFSWDITIARFSPFVPSVYMYMDNHRKVPLV